MSTISIASTPEQIAACFPVMAQLRPHLQADNFAATVERLSDVAGFEIAYLDDDGVKAVAGFRISEWLPLGRYLEIEDLVTTEHDRSKGYGGQLFNWLVDRARQQGCVHVRLLSALEREDAHRFYERNGMSKQAYYFSLDL